MPLIEFQMDGGKILATPTNEEYVPSSNDERAALDAQAERKKLEVKWDARRAKFFQWALEKPTELDILLDEVAMAGILFPFEYEDK